MTPKILTVTEEAEAPAEELTTVCSGWGLEHGEIIMHQGKPGAPVSHGMCDRCKLYMDAVIDKTPEELVAYRAYLESPIDPRD